MRGYARNLDHLRIHHVDSASSLKLQIYTILRDGAVGIFEFITWIPLPVSSCRYTQFCA